MIQDLNFDLQDVKNKIVVDKYGRVSAFLALKKPVGITSHDLVDQVRKKLKTRKVGHAGALDPFASGVMFILVGKKYTKLADTLINLDKSYKAKVLFGATTDSLDIEGELVGSSDVSTFYIDGAASAAKSFEGGYDQFVPVFSSVKVQGNKLRVLARKYGNHEFFAKEGKKHVRFFNDNSEIELPLPAKPVEISNMKIISNGEVQTSDLNLNNAKKISIPEQLPCLEVEFKCSKGTYVRQFAYDLAQEIDQVGMLIELERTSVGKISLDDCLTIEELVVPSTLV